MIKDIWVGVALLAVEAVFAFLSSVMKLDFAGMFTSFTGEVIIFVCAIVIGFFAIAYYLMQWRTHKLRKALSEARKSIDDYQAELKKRLEEDKELRLERAIKRHKEDNDQE